MLVEFYERDNIWWFKDEYGLECSTMLGTGNRPLESLSRKERLKTVSKLKSDGFTTDDIIDLFKAGVLK